ncbi:MAG: hypothetical protein ACXVPX_07220, partial [Actinomycetota bacterium]
MANNDRRGRWNGFDFGGGAPGEPRRLRASPWVWIAGFVVVLIAFNFFATPRPTPLVFTSFLQKAEAGQIVGTVSVSSTSVSGTYESGGHDVAFTSQMPPGYDTTELTKDLQSKGIAVQGVQPNGLSSFLLGWVAPLLLFGLLWFFLIRRMSGAQTSAALNLGRNRVKIYDRKEMKTTFQDVAGVDEAVEELGEIV